MGQPLHGRKSKVWFPSGFNGLVILVAHSRRLGELLLRQTKTLAQRFEPRQQAGKGLAWHGTRESRLPLRLYTPLTVVHFRWLRTPNALQFQTSKMTAQSESSSNPFSAPFAIQLWVIMIFRVVLLYSILLGMSVGTFLLWRYGRSPALAVFPWTMQFAYGSLCFLMPISLLLICFKGSARAWGAVGLYATFFTCSIHLWMIGLVASMDASKPLALVALLLGVIPIYFLTLFEMFFSGGFVPFIAYFACLCAVASLKYLSGWLLAKEVARATPEALNRNRRF